MHERDVTWKTDREWTALHAAAKDNHLAIVACLVSAATAVDCRDSDGQTPLHIAAAEGHLDIVQYLVGQVADRKKYINLGGKFNDTALHAATLTSNDSVAAFLLEFGADLLALDTLCCSAAMWASRYDESSAVLALLLERDPGQIDKTWDNRERWTCLHIASQANAVTNTELLLRRGANPSLQDIDGRTAWELACAGPNPKTQCLFACMELEEKVIYPQDLGSVLATGIESWNSLPNNTYLWATAVLYRIARKQIGSDWYNAAQRYLLSSKLNDGFVESMEPGNFLNAREEYCIFDQIEHSGPATQVVGLSIPYFDSETWDNLKKRSKTHKNLSTGWKYCCTDNPMKGMAPHLPLTLDEYCKPVLGTTLLDERNKDQVLLWYERRRRQGIGEQRKPSEQVNMKPPDPPGSGRLLTVCQAWVWKADNLVVVVAFSGGKRKCRMGIVEVSESLSLKGYESEQASNIADFLAELVGYFDRPASAGLAEPLLNTFEKAITTISDDVNEYIRHPDIGNMDISTEAEYYHNIGDIREELSMVKSVLRQQEEQWTTFMSILWPTHCVDGKITPKFIPEGEQTKISRTLSRTYQQFRQFNSRIYQLDEDAKRVEDSISKRLDLKAKHASIKQAQNSAKEAHATAVMSAAVFGFTIVTIIFTPMSFMISILALPIQKLQKNQMVSRWSTDSGAYPAKYVGKWLAAGGLPSIFLTVVLVWLAVEFGLRDPITKKSIRWLKSWFKPEEKAEANVTTTNHQGGNITTHAKRPDSEELEAGGRPDVQFAQPQPNSTKSGEISTKVSELGNEHNAKPALVDVEDPTKIIKHRRSGSHHDLEKGQAPPISGENVR